MIRTHKRQIPGLLATLFACLLAAPAAGQSPPREEAPKPEADAEDPVAECNDFMEAYLESASRKLYRSLSGHDFTLESINLQPWMDLRVESGGETRVASFSLIEVKDGKVAALVDSERSVRKTLVVADTGAGPLVTSFTWPAESEIGSQKDCRPIRSRIEHPEAPLSRLVDVEPFKFWGLRVLWRLPAEFKRGASPDDSERSLFQTIKESVSESD